MAEGLFLALCGVACFQFSSAPWLLANSDERFLLVFGERNARIFNVLVAAVLFAMGFGMLLAKVFA